MIVIPAVDVRDGRVVRLTHGRVQELVLYADDPVAVARGFAQDGARRLHVVDLDAALDDGHNRGVIEEIVRESGVPVQVGGGLRSEEAIDAALEVGADRAILGTEAVRDPGFLRRCADRHGDRIVAAVDTDGTAALVKGWTEAGGAYEEVLAGLEEAGAPRFLVTSTKRDGTLRGPDVDLYRRTRTLTSVPVLASGGVGSVEDVRALAGTGVEGVVVGKALYEGAFTLAEAMAAADGAEA